MADVAMPRLSDSMEEGTILKWLKSDGDEVEKGEELVEIETDKANMTYEADEAGTLSIVAKEGDTLAVGETIATIGEGGGRRPDDEATDEDAEEPRGEEARRGATRATRTRRTRTRTRRTRSPRTTTERRGGRGGEEDEDEEREPEADGGDEEEPASEDEGGDEAKGEDKDSGGGNGRVKASPVARRMARELGVELAAWRAPAPAGGSSRPTWRPPRDGTEAERGGGEPRSRRRRSQPRTKEEPTCRSRGRATPATGRGEIDTEELTRLQQTVARRMAESKATAPEFVITCEVDMEDAVAFRAQLKAAAGEDAAGALVQRPRRQGVPRSRCKRVPARQRRLPRRQVRALLARERRRRRGRPGRARRAHGVRRRPQVARRDRARRPGARRARPRRARSRRPSSPAGTFTVSNLGMFGITRFVAVINPPQAAILAVGEMTPRPVVRDGEVVVRPIMELTLSCDHRILYGADAAQFLGRIRERLENPLSLVL